MEVKELMIGDWVRLKADGSNEILQVTYVRKDGVGFDKYAHFFDEIEPIPLTPEILEKNGFERRGGISYNKSNIGLIILHWNDDLCFLNYSKKNIPPIMIPFHYVHELQRALRCCGLWELAENFKV